ncbi:MAG: TetR/AcrR family transcriptional regulator [Flavihumibacter sp.]
MTNGQPHTIAENAPVTDPIRQDILHGARELFIHFGFRKTTMEDIARKIGKSKSALYYYFKTKEEIFDAMAQEDMERQFQAARENMQQEKTAQGRFRAFVVTMFQHLCERTEEFSVFRAEVIENPLLVLRLARKNDATFEEILRQLLAEGMQQGETRELSPGEIDIWAKAVNAALRGIGSRLFLGDDGGKLKQHLAFIADSLFAGIARIKT